MTTPQPRDDQKRTEDQGCCGGEGLDHGGAWVPAKGEPLAAGCQLCRKSPTDWRAK
jgi:hypothetical protein